jgi:alkylhydroperoxidase/carboxymuconolactone decarboxylase family protein YurZ
LRSDTIRPNTRNQFIEIHVKEARAAGATDQDLAETAMVAAVMRAGAVVTHASHAFKS